MKIQATTRKKQKYKKGNQQYMKKKKEKTPYAGNGCRKEADRVQAENRRGRWRWKLVAMETREKTEQWTVSSRADSEKIGGAHKNKLKGESLSESPKSNPHKVCQISRINRKTTHQYKWQKHKRHQE